MKKTIIMLAVAAFATSICIAQQMTPEQYIAQYKDLAIREMKRMGVPAAITLAQGLLETENGNSELFKNSNNHFGIKCKSSWTAPSFNHDDDAKGECFRVYKDAEASYRDHSNFLRGTDRYLFLFRLNPLDYKGWAYGLKNAGYATNPNYPLILIKNIEQYNLQQYSLQGAEGMVKADASKYKSDKEELIDTTAMETNTTAIAVPEPTTQPDENTIEAAATKVFTVNGSKCVFARKGSSLLMIATKNNIGLDKLLEYNEIGEDGILGKDQTIFLQKKAKRSDEGFYILKQGETLYDAAQKNGIQYQYLLDYNNLNVASKVAPGTKLYLQPTATPAQKPATASYIVQSKDGLYSIAKKFGITIQQIRDWNNLQNDSLSVGQQLTISQ